MSENNGYSKAAKWIEESFKTQAACIKALEADVVDLKVELATLKAQQKVEGKVKGAVWGGVGGVPSLALILWYIIKNMK